MIDRHVYHQSIIIVRAVFVVLCVQDCLREPAAMTLIYKNTFLEFVWNYDDRVRSRSAPAMSTGGPVCTKSHELRRAKKTKRNDKRRRDADEEAFLEFGSLARQERWGLMVKKMLRARRLQDKWGRLTEVFLRKAIVMKMRASVPLAVYRQLAYSRRSSDVHMLWSIGVFRHGDYGVEIWSADLPLKHPVMVALLIEVKHYVEMWAADAFQLTMRGCSTSKLCKCNSTSSVQSLRAVAALSFGVDEGVRLIHLGIELKDGCHLAGYGVGPGSVVVLR